MLLVFSRYNICLVAAVQRVNNCSLALDGTAEADWNTVHFWKYGTKHISDLIVHVKSVWNWWAHVLD